MCNAAPFSVRGNLLLLEAKACNSSNNASCVSYESRELQVVTEKSGSMELHVDTRFYRDDDEGK